MNTHMISEISKLLQKVGEHIFRFIFALIPVLLLDNFPFFRFHFAEFFHCISWVDCNKLFTCVLWHINHCRLFNVKSIFIQIISSISKNSVKHCLNVKNISISSYLV